MQKYTHTHTHTPNSHFNHMLKFSYYLQYLVSSHLCRNEQQKMRSFMVDAKDRMLSIFQFYCWNLLIITNKLMTHITNWVGLILLKFISK